MTQMMIMNHKKKSGFTLIEVVIYIALLTIIIGGVFAISMGLAQNIQKTADKAITQEEGNFVLRKINWALAGVDFLTAITSDTLILNKTGFSPNPITIHFDSGNSLVEMKRGGNPLVPLTSVNVKITNLLFTYIPAVPPAPDGVKVDFNVNGVHFETTKYIR